jgi:hypothetical protein
VVSSRLRAYLMIAGFFALGAVGGAAAGRAYTQRELALGVFSGDRQTREAMFLDALSHELQLSDEQREQVADLHRRFQGKRKELRRTQCEPCSKAMDDLHQAMDGEMSAVLDPDQTARWREMVARRRPPRGEESH